MDKTLNQIDELKKNNSSSNYGTMTPNNMGAPNFYVMDPGSPNKKMDTPGGFSYKASTTMNKLGFADSGINDGHSGSGLNTGTEKKPEYDEFGTKIPDYGRYSDTGKEYVIGPKTTGVEKGRQTLQGPTTSTTTTFADSKKPRSQRKPAEYTQGATFQTTYQNKKGDTQTVKRVMGDTKKERDKKYTTRYFKEGKVYDTKTPYTRETLTEKPFPQNKKKKK